MERWEELGYNTELCRHLLAKEASGGCTPLPLSWSVMCQWGCIRPKGNLFLIHTKMPREPPAAALTMATSEASRAQVCRAG